MRRDACGAGRHARSAGRRILILVWTLALAFGFAQAAAATDTGDLPALSDAGNVPAFSGADGLPAFPGALGFGANTVGGRGGLVIKVTTLAEEGPGSLRAALEEREGPRIVVFDVAGEISLSRPIQVKGQVTVAGQTAPAPGVTVTGARLQITGDDVILRGMRLRPGAGPGQAFEARDGISIGARDRIVSRVILDGNSVTWATDENVAIWPGAEDVTISNNIIAEALNEAGHPQGAHSMGLLVGGQTRRVSILRNLLTSNRWRNPQIARAVPAEVVNNFIVNTGPGGLSIGGSPSEIDIIGNVFEAGPGTPDPQERAPIALRAGAGSDRYFVHDNRTPMGRDAVRGPGAARLADAPLVARDPASVLPGGAVRAHVLAAAGARAPALDAIDRRILAEAAARSGSPVNAPPGLGLAEVLAQGVSAPAPDRDGDGLPDAMEAALGADPDRVDSHLPAAPGGYAFIEIYANGLLAP